MKFLTEDMIKLQINTKKENIFGWLIHLDEFLVIK